MTPPALQKAAGATGAVAGSSSDQLLQRLGLRDPREVIDLLAMLSVDGESVIGSEAQVLDPTQKLQAVLSYFKGKGLNPNELPYLAASIKRGIRNGSIKFDANNRLSLTAGDLQQLTQHIQNNNLPPHERHSTKPLSSAGAKSPALVVQHAEVREVRLHPEVPAATAARVEIAPGTDPFFAIASLIIKADPRYRIGAEYAKGASKDLKLVGAA